MRRRHGQLLQHALAARHRQLLQRWLPQLGSQRVQDRSADAEQRAALGGAQLGQPRRVSRRLAAGARAAARAARRAAAPCQQQLQLQCRQHLDGLGQRGGWRGAQQRTQRAVEGHVGGGRAAAQRRFVPRRRQQHRRLLLPQPVHRQGQQLQQQLVGQQPLLRAPGDRDASQLLQQQRGQARRATRAARRLR